MENLTYRMNRFILFAGWQYLKGKSVPIVISNRCITTDPYSKPLHLHTVSFGPTTEHASLERISAIGKEVYLAAPR